MVPPSPIDPVAAKVAASYLEAAKAGDAQSQSFVGTCYVMGYGVVKSETQGVAWISKAAEQNLAEAEVKLAFSFLKGIGLTKDETKAILKALEPA